jgi:tetratricopeptide (TPR) repeat protein
MKKSLFILAGLLAAALTLHAQAPALHESVTPHYRVYSEINEKHARETSARLEALYGLFNSYFHFDAEAQKARLKVRIFSTKQRYEDFLNRIIGQTREDFIYLHYSDLEKSELAGYAAPAELYDPSLNHQAFIQFLRAFIPNPPLWMREGFAVYFEKVQFDPASGKSILKENLAWLETLQAIAQGRDGRKLIPTETILAIDVDQARGSIDIFYPQAWAMVAFLLDPVNQTYRRILWDGISAMRPESSLAQNVRSIQQRALRWYAADELNAAFIDYLGYKKSFRALVQEGIDFYSRNELGYAEENFFRAMDLEPGNYIPYYYLGLISYNNKSYSKARDYYDDALRNNAPAGLTYYALGVNAYADNNFDDAVASLGKAREADPAYRDKAEELLRRIRK